MRFNTDGLIHLLDDPFSKVNWFCRGCKEMDGIGLLGNSEDRGPGTEDKGLDQLGMLRYFLIGLFREMRKSEVGSRKTEDRGPRTGLTRNLERRNQESTFFYKKHRCLTMASAFTHAFSALALGSVLQSGKLHKGLILTGMISAAMPDLDVVAFWLDIPYEHPLGHRGFTHSILFAALWALGIGYFFWRKTDSEHRIRLRVWFYLFLCTASHGVLDAMTTGGRGVGFFIPMDNERYFLPWRFIKVSPIRASAFFSDYGMKVMANEFVTVWLPCMILMILAWIFRQVRKQ